MHRIKRSCEIFGLALFIALFAAQCLAAAERLPAPPDDPRQSITWWKAYRISAAEDGRVAEAEAIFQDLLRAWDSARLEPGLYVVKSSQGPWAASLADGNILLSREAIDSCMRFGEQRGRHLLAFVLAHELAHQRADDLWHQRFFRMLGPAAGETTRQALQNLQLDAKTIASMQQKEAQADHDGLILMSSVGYDPYQILDKQDFFTAWVENIWGQSCHRASSRQAIHQACEDARGRALRTRAQLGSLATQSMLYELGVQAFVAADYPRAREYFSAYARDYPGRAVLSALGLSYLAEAVALQNQLIELSAVTWPAFYYPLMLDARSDMARPELAHAEAGQRSSTEARVKRLQQQQASALRNSIRLFEKTLQLAPEHKKTYLLLASAYLLQGNSYMVRGVLQGRYLPKFGLNAGEDAAVTLLLAMTRAVEGKPQQAQAEFRQLLQQLAQKQFSPAIGQNLLQYSSYYNYAALLQAVGKEDRARQLWQQLAKQSAKSGNGLLLQLALHQLNQRPGTRLRLSMAPNIDGYRLGDRQQLKAEHYRVDDLWIDGELHRVYRLANGSRMVTTAGGRIISAWQDMGRASIEHKLRPGDPVDRPFKTLGIPDRHLLLSSGEYLAYDQYGLALHINNNRVQGWFLYQAKDE